MQGVGGYNLWEPMNNYTRLRKNFSQNLSKRKKRNMRRKGYRNN